MGLNGHLVTEPDAPVATRERINDSAIQEAALGEAEALELQADRLEQQARTNRTRAAMLRELHAVVARHRKGRDPLPPAETVT